jgi:nucleoside-diphosphate-sugar epimerase
VKILITGATGFLGAHLVRRLAREDVQMALLIRPGSNLWRIDPLPKNAGIIPGSLSELPTKAIEQFVPDTIVHAAWHGVSNQHRNDATQTENLTPTLKLAEIGCKHFIGLGSQAEYGPLNKKISETDSTKPTTLYGETKLAACLETEKLCSQNGVRWSWLRVFSTYGPLEDLSWMIPYLIRELLAGKKPSLTACEQRWDYLFGADAADAIWSVAKSKATGLFNLGSGGAESLRKIVETLRDAIDPKLPLGIGEVPYRPDQVMHLEADVSKLTKATGWTPATRLEEGLKQTVAWHRQQHAH